MQHQTPRRWTIPAFIGTVILALLLFQLESRAALAESVADVRTFSTRATDPDPAIASQAIAQLRAAGPAGLAALLDTYADAVRQHRAAAAATASDPDDWTRIASAIDSVAAQKDAWASGLYWYTDFEAAKAAARKSGKPILSLRLLGTLDSEFSCANSRFFRTVLYANAAVSKTLSERFILHWKSVRPAPKITIDFGDGRVVERTVTGNSIHYVLDAEGRVIDGIPGLYGPKPFLRLITDAADRHTEPSTSAMLSKWHAAKRDEILIQWRDDLCRAGAIRGTDIDPVQIQRAPSATEAVRRAVGKTEIESNIVTAIVPDVRKLEAASDDATWVKLAAFHCDDAKLDAGSRALMVAKNPTALAAGRIAMTKAVVENPLVRIIGKFEQSIAEDTVRNEYLFHRQIHDWLAAGRLLDGFPASDVDRLNERVYADLFLTPGSDPWLGLMAPDTYSALADDGLCKIK